LEPKKKRIKVLLKPDLRVEEEVAVVVEEDADAPPQLDALRRLDAPRQLDARPVPDAVVAVDAPVGFPDLLPPQQHNKLLQMPRLSSQVSAA
jgi:hypothetical protein